MRKLSRSAILALMLAVPTAMASCGGDDDTPVDPGTGGTGGKGGGAGKGGAAGKGGSATGGSSSGGEGASETGGTGSGGKGGSGGGKGGTGGKGGSGGNAGEPEGGTGNEGATPSEGGTGGMVDPVDCDLSGENKERETLPANITEDMTLDSAKDYYINGFVHINDGATLTIPACTRLEGSPAPDPGVLVAQRGARIVAVGTPDEPILFTSAQAAGDRQSGQWGGVVLLGRAPITRAGGAQESLYEGLTDEAYAYGGTDADDDSGTLQYVRIEFGGYEILPDKEVNGLSMAGIGSGTTIDHIMVSNTLDDCFEWWGGSVSATHLVCNNPGDDYFDGDEGWQGSVEYFFGRRAQYAISSDNPNGFELDSINSGETPRTAFSFTNGTLCGTGEDSLAVEQSYGMVLRELATGTMDNLALLGFDYGIDTRDMFVTGDVTISNSPFWSFVFTLDNPAETDDDTAFVDESIFLDGDNNELVDPSLAAFSVAECLEIAGPADAVLDSDIGAFTGGAAWLDGAWVNWAAE